MRHPVCERILNEWLNATWAATKCTCLHGTFKSFAIREVEEPLSTDTLSTRNYNRSIGKLTRLGRNHTLYFLIPDSLNSLLLFFFFFFVCLFSSLSFFFRYHFYTRTTVRLLGATNRISKEVPCNERCSTIKINYKI